MKQAEYCDSDEIEDEKAANRIIETDDGNAFILDEKSGISISQKDVREVQLAKSAIASGIACMLNDAGIEINEVQKLIRRRLWFTSKR